MKNPTRFRGVNNHYPRTSNLLSAVVAHPNTIAHLRTSDETEFLIQDSAPVIRTAPELYNERIVHVLIGEETKPILVANLSMGTNKLKALEENRFIFNAELGVFMWKEDKGVNVLPLDEKGFVTDVHGAPLFQLIKPILELVDEKPPIDGSLLNGWASLPSAGVVFIQKLVGPIINSFRTTEFALADGSLNIAGADVIDPEKPLRFVILNEKMERMRVERLMNENFIALPAGQEAVVFDTYGGTSVVITATFCALFENQLAKQLHEQSGLNGIYQEGVATAPSTEPGHSLRSLMTQIDDQIQGADGLAGFELWQERSAELELDERGLITAPDVFFNDEDYLLDATTFGGVSVEVFSVEGIRLDAWSRSVITNRHGDWEPALGLEPHELITWTNLDELGTDSVWADQLDAVLVVYDGKYAFLFDTINEVLHYNTFDNLNSMLQSLRAEVTSLGHRVLAPAANAPTGFTISGDLGEQTPQWNPGDHPVPQQGCVDRSFQSTTPKALDTVGVIRDDVFRNLNIQVYELEEQILIDLGNHAICRLDGEGDWHLAVGLEASEGEGIMRSTLAEFPIQLDRGLSYMIVSGQAAYLYDLQRKLVHTNHGHAMFTMLTVAGIKFNKLGDFINGSLVTPMQNHSWNPQAHLTLNPEALCPGATAQPFGPQALPVIPSDIFTQRAVTLYRLSVPVLIDAVKRTLSVPVSGAVISVGLEGSFYHTNRGELHHVQGGAYSPNLIIDDTNAWIYDYHSSTVVQLSLAAARVKIGNLLLTATPLTPQTYPNGFGQAPTAFGSTPSVNNPWHGGYSSQWGMNPNPFLHSPHSNVSDAAAAWTMNSPRAALFAPGSNWDHLDISTADIARAITLHPEMSNEEIKSILAALITQL